MNNSAKKYLSRKVPETKEEVVEHFKSYPDEFLSEVLIGLFEVRMLQGDTVMQAYEATLRAAVERPTLHAPDAAKSAAETE